MDYMGRALSFSWRYPHWWWGAFRGVIRRCIANAVADYGMGIQANERFNHCADDHRN